MKKIFLCLSVVCLVLLTGCGKKSEKDIIKDFQDKVLNTDAYYQLTGIKRGNVPTDFLTFNYYQFGLYSLFISIPWPAAANTTASRAT